MQLEALGRLILRLVNQKMGGYCPLVHLTDLIDHEFQTLSGYTYAHKVRHEALGQFNLEASVLVNEPTTDWFNLLD
jgi:hypothetical protein